MAGNRLTVEVVLVGPRAGETCSLAGFDFNAGVAEVPRHAATALHILGKYHNAFQVDSREYEEAHAKWAKEKASAESTGSVDPKLAVALEDARALINAKDFELERLRAELREAKDWPAEPVKAQSTTELAKAPAEETPAADTKAKGKGKGKE
ncbi:hypothetical protein LXT21_44400 [Myxococcus sp. K38C18041901]|uniref:hypothetical protein n=1 Tax=Myxococcus guangdongensis TaxID=2906760 RepID=UPI0020A6F2E2|nr:hypothetical protein [Myxococcus guangdongensis]MCP3065832.1 hypothetical protein [Myxococcus guangdongensis]